VSQTVSEILLLGGVAIVASLLLWRGAVARAALERRVRWLETMYDIGRVLLTDRNLRGVLSHVAESAGRLLGTDTAHVTLVAGEGRLALEAATGPLAPMVGSAVEPETSLPGWVVARSQPLVLHSPRHDGLEFRSLHERLVLRRALVLPLIAKGRCIGALGVENPRDDRTFGEDDIELLRDLANYTALVIEGLRAQDELAERERRGALLNRVNSRIRQSLELPVILETAARELGSALGASRCLVRQRRGTELLPTPAEWDAPGVSPAATGNDPGRPLMETAVRERRSVQTPDARPGSSIPIPADSPPVAVLAVPLILRGEAIGAIALHQVGLPRLWRPGEIGLLEEAAAELAIAISNARLYRSTEEASRELASKISELERANRLKAQFLANMSHELRTPLNSIIGFSEMLLLGAHGKISADQRDALETVARNGRHLLGLVNDILDLSKIDAGRMELHLGPTDLRRLVTDVLSGMDSMVQAKGHRVTLALGEERLDLTADEMRIRQVLFNLLSNSVKFTPPGGEITVRGERLAARTEGEMVFVSVTDNGIGIAPEDLPRLFSEFTQLDASHARRYEGTGLGLALSKRFVEMHGGRIGVESTRGAGSTFWIELPVAGPRPLVTETRRPGSP
jgi:signal transduction histidine kinase